MQIAQDISSGVRVKKRRCSGLHRGFLTCAIGAIDKPGCMSYFTTVPNGSEQDCAFTALSVQKHKSCNSKPHCRRQFSWACGSICEGAEQMPIIYYTRGLKHGKKSRYGIKRNQVSDHPGR